MANVAFLGLGRMGRGMAMRLLGARHALKIYNRTTSRAEPLARSGALVARTPREAAEGADAVIAMLSDDAASREVWMGPDGVLSARSPESCIAIECSTLSFGWVKELAQAAKDRGLRYIDAPVVGSPESAGAGQLTFLIGAQEGDLEKGKWIFCRLAESIFHFGGIGCGTVYKLILNMQGAVQIAAAAESLAIAERAGLNMAAVVEGMSRSLLASTHVIRNTRRMLDDSHETDIVFPAHLRAKDVQYGLQLASSLRIGAPYSQLAYANLLKLLEAGLANSNESKIIEISRRQPPQQND